MEFETRDKLNADPEVSRGALFEVPAMSAVSGPCYAFLYSLPGSDRSEGGKNRLKKKMLTAIGAK